MFKAEKGITLVALIITIIVLLILAGVVISMTIGNDGIISKSQTAADTYKLQAANEANDITTANTIMDAYYNNVVNHK